MENKKLPAANGQSAERAHLELCVKNLTNVYYSEHMGESRFMNAKRKNILTPEKLFGNDR